MEIPEKRADLAAQMGSRRAAATIRERVRDVFENIGSRSTPQRSPAIPLSKPIEELSRIGRVPVSRAWGKASHSLQVAIVGGERRLAWMRRRALDGFSNQVLLAKIPQQVLQRVAA